MARAVQQPMFEHRSSPHVGLDPARVVDSPSDSPRVTAGCSRAVPFDCAITCSPLTGATVLSRSPWKTMVGTVCPVPARTGPPCFMAAKAEGMSLAAPQASPEWTPTAA